MKFLNKIFLSLSAVAGVLALNGCNKEFSELNQDPAAVVEATPSFLMAEAVRQFEPSAYQDWFYNAKMFTQWSQMAVKKEFSDDAYAMTATGKQGSASIDMLKYRNDLRHIVEMDEQGNHISVYKAYLAVCDILSIYCGIFDSDVYGSIPYTEAAMYVHGGTLTPKYDRVEDLYNLWLTTLDECIANLTDKNQEFVSSEDAVYGGDTGKWAKLANSLKLKIAVRLLAQNKAKALEIANAVKTAGCGYISEVSDDFLFNKADVITSGDADYVFHFGDAIWAYELNANRNVMNFLLASKDPRVRFIYTKNGFNSKVVDAFIAEGKFENLPTYVKENVVLNPDGTFKEWGGMGEPWVRYGGMPVVWSQSAEYNAVKDEFFTVGQRYKLENAKGFDNVSYYNEEMIRGRVDFTLPTAEEDKTIQDKDDNPWWGLFLGAGEVNLYLAELSFIGGNYGDAESFYTKGVRASVQEYDKLAGLNRIPYYGTTYGYDPHEKSIELKDGEIDAMLSTSNVALSGNNELSLEKIYLQQLIHFSLQPDDQFVTARRSGYPKVGSTLLPFVKMSQVEMAGIPRRFELGEPLATDLMRDIKAAAYKEQGITTGTNQSGTGHLGSTVLNTERLWMDKNAPQWGEGATIR